MYVHKPLNLLKDLCVWIGWILTIKSLSHLYAQLLYSTKPIEAVS